MNGLQRHEVCLHSECVPVKNRFFPLDDPEKSICNQQLLIIISMWLQLSGCPHFLPAVRSLPAGAATIAVTAHYGQPVLCEAVCVYCCASLFLPASCLCSQHLWSAFARLAVLHCTKFTFPEGLNREIFPFGLILLKMETFRLGSVDRFKGTVHTVKLHKQLMPETLFDFFFYFGQNI